jgi:signal transduction histidine kinase/ActR/RegA family two-component response regulator
MNIKNFTKLTNFALPLLLLTMGVLVFHSLSIREDITENERHRYKALLLANELLQSSDDLTSMARAYVITGAPIYKLYFQQILDIRAGKKPRPLNYSATYWHLAAAGKPPTVEHVEAISLDEMFRRSHFREEEYDLLRRALENSNELVSFEKRAFAVAEGLSDDGRGNPVKGKPNRELAIQMLVGPEYLAGKAAIMQPIHEFIEMFSSRMETQANLGVARLERQIIFEMAVIFVALIATIAIIFYTRLGILQPLAELARQVAGITRGARPSRYGQPTENEVAKLGEALAMADAEKRQLLENERIARNEAERASRLKDEFLATLSHELRTPLNAILGWAQLILSGSMKPEDVHRGLETIERNARAQNKLIEDLLEMSSIISGKVRLEMREVDIIDLVEAAIDSINPTAQAKGVTLSAKIGCRHGLIWGDHNRLQQIFWNILSNSIKFTPKGGRIEVLAERVGSYLEIRINDSGLGIAQDFMPYVFDRFRQADPSLTRQFGGLGLGLAIVKQLVELHGGMVRAESEGVGKGATFTVSLPLASMGGNGGKRDRENEAALKPGVQVASNLMLAGMNVLVVDDELDSLELIKGILTQCHANVITAASAGEALWRLETVSPDVIVSDIGMPEKNGYQLIHEVRNLPEEKSRTIPAIALTAFARPEDRTRAIEAGFQVHLTKPVEALELINAIRELTRHPGPGRN